MATSADDPDEVVYAAILARVERPERVAQSHRVLQQEWEAVGRRMRRVSASLTALRQLRAASEVLRPSGDWLPATLQSQLTSAEELARRISTAIDGVSDRSEDRKCRKRRREEKKESVTKDVAVVEISDSEEEVTLVVEKEGVGLSDGYGEAVETADSAVRPPFEAESAIEEEEKVVGTAHVGCEHESSRATTLAVSGARDAANGMVEMSNRIVMPEVLKERRTTGDGELKLEAMRVKREGVVAIEEESGENEAVAMDIGNESPMELEVLESSDEETAMELEVPESDDSALELDVLESESDEDFPSCLEVATKLQRARKATQVKEFPAMVDQLRSYLQNTKHFTAAELDGYLFAHKHFSATEVEEVALSIESIVSMGMRLPLRPQIKLALKKLLGTIKQFELTLGELPTSLRPVAEEFTSYLSSRLEDAVPISDNFFAVMEV